MGLNELVQIGYYVLVKTGRACSAAAYLRGVIIPSEAEEKKVFSLPFTKG